MRNNILETLVGLIVLLLFIFIIAFYSFKKTAQISQGYEVCAFFDQVTGINIGTYVKIAGVSVGSVQGVALDQNTYRAKVFLKIRKDIKIPIDSQLEVSSDGLFGNKFIALIPGPSDIFVKSKGEITQTQSAISIEGIISKLVTSNS